jgi:4,5-DOPA dioxygenase extradiol
MTMPSLFLSHGAPTLPLTDTPARAFLQQLGATLERPKAILVISAHWETAVPTVNAVDRNETIHDFGGFPRALYDMRYPAPGHPQLAARIAALLDGAGFATKIDRQRGLDHGAWVPLSIMFPQADIPVAQLSLQPERDPAWHLALGRALRPLREQGVLIVGSGAITHNLRAVFRHPQDEPAPAWVTEFCDWIAARISEGNLDALAVYRTLAPHAVQNHPTDEHLLPLFVALGAASKVDDARHLNRVMTFGLLAMDAWLFDGAG